MIQALWSLDQQFQNKNGSILTHGKIYVYYKGRTALATTYSDEDGTVVNPNPILLDNNGRAACFASSSYAYTILVCDAYGKELFSYDLTLHDAVATADKVFVIGSDGSVRVDTTQLPNGVQYDLSVNTDVIATKQSVDDVKDDIDDLSDTVDNHTTEIGQLQDDVDDIEDTLANKKDKQSELIYGGNTHMTITRIKQDEDGEITEVKYEPIDLPPEVPNVDITSPNGTIDVQSSTDAQTNTKTFSIDVVTQEPTWHYWTGNNAWTQISTSAWTQINRPSVGTGSTPHAWNPDIKRGIYDAKAHFTVTFHNYENSKTVPNQIIQVGFRAKFVGKNDPTAIRYEDLGSWTYDPSLYTTEAYQYNFAQESLRQNHDTSKIINVANYWGDTDFDVFFEAALLNTDGSQSVPSIDTVLFAEINYFGYHEVKGNIAGQGGGTTYTAGDGIDITNDVISTDIEVQNAEKVSVDLDFGNTIQTVSAISTDGSTVRTDGFNFTLPTIKAGDGISFTKVGTETTISMDSEVGDVVETVEKLKKDLDTQLTVNFDMPGIDNVYDFADTSVVPLTNGATMLCQAFTVPINHEIRVDDGVETEPTLLGIYAKQIFAHKIMLALYVYDFETGYTDYVGDTGPVNVAQGRNEYPLKHINPDITELKSSSVYYAALYLPSNAHSSGLYLAGCPSYSNASYINATPRFTIGVQNIIHNGSEIDMTDATTGRLDFNDGEGNYYIGPWSSSYNEIPSAPRFFMQIRNGEVQEPTVLTPFENITYQSIIRNENAVANDVFSTGDLGSASNPIVFQELTPNTDIDITSCTIYDGNATEAFGNTFAYFSSDFGTRYDVQSTVADASAGYGYSHTYAFASPVHLTAGTTYRWPVGIGDSDYFFALRTYDSSVTETKVLHLFGSVYNVSQWVNFSRANAGPAVALTLVDSNNTTWNV